MAESDRPEQEAVANLEERRRRLGDPEGPAAWKPPDGHFRTLFDSAPIGIAQLDGLGRLVDGNLALQRLLGFSLEECRGRPLTDFTHPNEVEAERKALRELQEGRRAHYHVERQYRQKDGGFIWVSTKISCGPAARDEPAFFIATLEDVSERRQAEEGLRLSNRRLTAWVSELEQRSREISLLSEMGDLFQACRSAEDAYAVILPDVPTAVPHRGRRRRGVSPAAHGRNRRGLGHPDHRKMVRTRRMLGAAARTTPRGRGCSARSHLQASPSASVVHVSPHGGSW